VPVQLVAMRLDSCPTFLAQDGTQAQSPNSPKLTTA
jgi:hypothetical protein